MKINEAHILLFGVNSEHLAKGSKLDVISAEVGSNPKLATRALWECKL